MCVAWHRVALLLSTMAEPTALAVGDRVVLRDGVPKEVVFKVIAPIIEHVFEPPTSVLVFLDLPESDPAAVATWLMQRPHVDVLDCHCFLIADLERIRRAGTPLATVRPPAPMSPWSWRSLCAECAVQ